MIKALQFATKAHEGQTRKNGVTPYITHPIGVAILAARYGGDDNQIMIAKLHDVIEDCDVTDYEIYTEFGEDIADGVIALTNTSKQMYPEMNRAGRKAIDNARLAKIPVRYKFVKLCDILYNVTDLDGLEKGFAIKFLREKLEQAEVVREGSEQVYQAVIEAVEERLEGFGAAR